MTKRIITTLIPLLGLIFFGSLNIHRQIRWREPTDGVIWRQKAEGLTAVRVKIDGPAYLAGIKRGDVLYTINNQPIESIIDVSKYLWIADSLDQKVTYEIIHEGDQIFPSFYLTKKGLNLIYLYLALVGLAALIIGYVVFLGMKRPFSVPYFLLPLLYLTYYAYNTFAPTGQLDLIDSIFYWLDSVALVTFPPLFLHFFLIFPRRKKNLKKRLASIHLIYFPGMVLLLMKIFINLPNFLKLDDIVILRFSATSSKLELFHFFLLPFITLFILVKDTHKSSTLIMKKQLRSLALGLGFGIMPFIIFYTAPFLLGQIPAKAAEFTVVFQAILPLTFAYAIGKYKLFDLELLFKKSIPLVFSYAVITILYLVVSSQTKIFSENRLNAIMLGVLAIILGATLYSPLKRFIQSLLDRAIYRRSYQYRKTLLSISQEISRERHLDKLAQSLLELIANALSLKYISLLLPLDSSPQSFSIFKAKGKGTSPRSLITFTLPVYNHLKTQEYLAAYAYSGKKGSALRINDLASFGIYHLMPLRVEDKLIGCLGMGKKTDNSFLNTEDWELLRTISSPVALAIENAYLYNQAEIRALELGRLKDYSENIIESLTVGVAVLDQEGKITGWNRVLEDTFQQKKESVQNKDLTEILGKKNFQAIFPSDSQQGFRLLSEIILEMPDGIRKIFDIAKTPLLDNAMNPYGTIVVFEDITDRISLQQQLVTSEKLASIGLLSAGVAHEINTPLTGISSYVQILQKKMTDSPHAHMLEKIDNQTERVASIVKNLLNFARNPSDSAFHPVDLKESLESILSLIDYKLKNMNISVKLDLIPLKAVWAQGERLQQVFINIILNALDAMPQGGILHIQLYRDGNFAVIRIEDSGTGISEEHLPHIFDPFFKTKGIGKGTGLGLSISYAIIKEHEGRISVESRPQKGTVFLIMIPMNLDKIKSDKTHQMQNQ